ncbi:MAG: DUF4493 domain-containing protein [Parabacteroides sp.]
MGQFSLRLLADTTSIIKDMSSGLTKSVASELEDFANIADYMVLVIKEKDTVLHYKRYDQMPASISLAEGAYQLIAKKGEDKPAEFLNPYFEGSTFFMIKEQMNTPIEVTCTLANARVTVDYTNDFLDAYDEYTALLSTPYTTADVELPKGETRAVYLQVASGGTQMAVGIRLKKKTETDAKTYWVQTPINLARRQDIHLIFKTDGEALEGIGLDVELDNTLEELTFTTTIPDFMWQQFKEPTLEAVEFASGDQIERIDAYSKEFELGYVVKGGLQHLYVKFWEEEQDEQEATLFDLVADEEKAKVQYYFFWTADGEENASLLGSKGGQIHLSSVIKGLPAKEGEKATYHLVFYAVDQSGKEVTSNEVRLTVNVPEAETPTIGELSALPEAVVEGNEMSENVTTYLHADAGIQSVDLTINEQIYNLLLDEKINQLYWQKGIEVQKLSGADMAITFHKAFTSILQANNDGVAQTYTYKLHMTDGNDKEAAVQPHTITVKHPNVQLLSTEVDAFAKRIVLRASMEEGAQKDKLRFEYSAGGSSWQMIPNMHITADGQQWVDTLRGLNPETEYQIRAVYQSMVIDGEKTERVSDEQSLLTEKEENLPAKDVALDEWSHKEVYKETIWSFGTTGLGIDEWWPYAEGGSSWWATRNALTTSQRSGVSCYYTSYSGTIEAEGYRGSAAEISTLGWGKGNTYTQSMTGVFIYNKTPGMLFIGSHSATSDGNETMNYGHDFASRPTAFSFYHKFKSINNESFKAYMVVENRDNGIVELGRGELVSSEDKDSFGNAPTRVEIHYSNTQLKATHMYIVFVSSTAAEPSVGLSNGSLDALNGYSDSRYVGNVLTVDNVELIYE